MEEGVPQLAIKRVSFACDAALLLTAPAAAEPLQVFLLAGQSNMRGHGYNIDLPLDLRRNRPNRSAQRKRNGREHRACRHKRPAACRPMALRLGGPDRPGAAFRLKDAGDS
jgi:hypothetical protein